MHLWKPSSPRLVSMREMRRKLCDELLKLPMRAPSASAGSRPTAPGEWWGASLA